MICKSKYTYLAKLDTLFIFVLGYLFVENICYWLNLAEKLKKLKYLSITPLIYFSLGDNAYDIKNICGIFVFFTHILGKRKSWVFSKCQSFRSYSCHDYGIMICKSTWTSRYSFSNVGDPYLKIVRIDIIKKSLNSKMLSHWHEITNIHKHQVTNVEIFTY